MVGVASSQGILALAALPGRTVPEAMGAEGRLPEPGALLELSQRIAAVPLTDARDPRAFADPTRHVARLSALVPERAAVVARIAAEACAIDAPLVGVHGDLHGGQLLVDADGEVVGVLDVDGAGPGHLAHDAGNLVAHLEAVGELHPELAGRADAYVEAVADAYRPVVGAADLARATAGAWLGLATGPHRSQDADWPDRTRRRIDRAAAVLEGR